MIPTCACVVDTVQYTLSTYHSHNTHTFLTPTDIRSTLQRFSDIYNGKLSVESTYFDVERANDKDKNPFAFFPHEHDPLKNKEALGKRSAIGPRKITIQNRTMTDLAKDERFIHAPSKRLFRLYFDELPTGKQGDRMLAYLRDGKFIDSR